MNCIYKNFIYKIKQVVLLVSVTVHFYATFGQHIADFTSVQPGNQTTDLILPSTHTFQYLIETGDPLTAGGTLPDRCDFTGYVPINGSSTEGYISINSEDTPGGVTVLDVQLDLGNKKWNVLASEAVDFSGVGGTRENCSGTVTPWGTVISCEESLPGATMPNGYKQYGWCIEIDPAAKVVVNNQKLWRLGNMKHENVVIHQNERTVYFGEDLPTGGNVYKFVANTAGDLTNGSLYVLQASIVTGTGQWLMLNNNTPSECNSTKSQAASAGASFYAGVEDVEISPIDGNVYFAVKNEATVYRFTDDDPMGGGTVSNYQIFVGGSPTFGYLINWGVGASTENWGTGNDNLAFDDLGNLWVLQDGSKNYIWVVENGHTQAIPKVKLFARTPDGCEPTGITFSPDFKYLFMSIMHPNASNSATTQLDAFGNPKSFDEDVAIVISRKEFLGDSSGMAVEVLHFDATLTNKGIELSFSLSEEPFSVIIEKYENQKFTTWKTLEPFGTVYQQIDTNPKPGWNDYRLSLIDVNGEFSQSEIVSVYVSNQSYRDNSFTGLVQLYNMQGQLIYQGVLSKLPKLQSGIYIIKGGKEYKKIFIQ